MKLAPEWLVLIYVDFHRQKGLIKGHFRFLCTNYDGHLRGQMFQ